MGFLASGDTVVITAKLTPFGRQQLLTNSSSIITQFSLGDSDANYYGELALGNGDVTDMAGEIGANNLFSNGLYSGVKIESPITVNAGGDTKKLVEAGSQFVVITPTNLTITGITETDLAQLTIDRTLGDSDGNSNLFHTFGLPITQDDKDLYTTFTSPTGYLDTAIRNFNKDKVVVIGIDKCKYGEILDGKAVKVEVTTTGATTYTLFSTFQKSLTPATTVDSQVKELESLGSAIGNNVAFLFSDDIVKPNSNSAKSWSTGFGTNKPFSLNSKELFNSVSVPSTSTNVDSAVGIAYLDKGIIVITHPDIVDNFDETVYSSTTVTFGSISNEVAQNITCIVERDEFATTNNRTHSTGELIRVSEVALYDNFNNLIAFGKSNEHIIIGANQFMALGVRIIV